MYPVMVCNDCFVRLVTNFNVLVISYFYLCCVYSSKVTGTVVVIEQLSLKCVVKYSSFCRSLFFSPSTVRRQLIVIKCMCSSSRQNSSV